MKRLNYKVCLGALVCSLLLLGCGSSSKAPVLKSASVGKPLVREVVEWDEYPGRLESPHIVNVAARVSGIIEQAPFTEGAVVHVGDVLFVIDPRPFVADVKRKDGDLNKAHASFEKASASFRRYEKLRNSGVIAAEQYDDALASMRQAQAEIGIAEADLELSKLNLEWSRVVAPITGRVSRKLVTEGNLVSGGTGQATQLTTVTSIDPLYCYVSIPERNLVKYHSFQNGSGEREKTPAWIRLETEENFGRQGYIDFVDNRVNPSTGTVEIRAVIPNPIGDLTAGLFARMRVPGSASYQATLVPDRIIGTNQDTRFVLVINNDDIVEQRPVKIGALFGSLRAVTSGLSAQDRVVLTAIQQLAAGTKVDPNEGSFEIASLNPFLPSTAAPVLLEDVPKAQDLQGGATNEASSSSSAPSNPGPSK